MKNKKIIGVIHLLALPGTPSGVNAFETVLERAIADATALKRVVCSGPCWKILEMPLLLEVP